MASRQTELLLALVSTTMLSLIPLRFPLLLFFRGRSVNRLLLLSSASKSSHNRLLHSFNKLHDQCQKFIYSNPLPTFVWMNEKSKRKVKPSVESFPNTLNKIAAYSLLQSATVNSLDSISAIHSAGKDHTY